MFWLRSLKSLGAVYRVDRLVVTAGLEVEILGGCVFSKYRAFFGFVSLREQPLNFLVVAAVLQIIA